MGKEKYQGRKYVIQEYDPAWVLQYKTEVKGLQKVLGAHVISIEHIGSTSVPELAGKPLIDILGVVENIATADLFAGLLEPLCYISLGQYVMEGSRLFVKERDGERLVNLHFFEKGHPHIEAMLKLRDYFRTHPEIVSEYSRLKFDLFEKYPDDYGSYRHYKDEWMNALKEKIGIRG